LNIEEAFVKQVPAICSRVAIALLLATSVAWAQNNSDNNGNHGSRGGGRSPNILFIIMDDVGIDQLTAFGYGGVDAAKTPNIDAIARAGVRFRNVWAMPECSPSRAVFFEGRYPLRTNVFGALLDDDLANSQVSPYEVTTPRLLKTRGYDSGDFGKFHLGEQTHNPFHTNLVQSLGWDYFDGFLEGAPHPIDESAGGAGGDPKNPTTIYPCGFVPNEIPGVDNGGANSGSCRFSDNSCQDLTVTAGHPTPGKYCLEQGGVFIPKNSCRQAPPQTLTFEVPNGYYVWPRVISHADGQAETIDYADPRARGFVGEATTTSAVSWINSEKNADKSWMATVAFPQIHTPYQQVPESLLPAGSPSLNNLNCMSNIANDIPTDHLLSNQMLESMDAEIGRLMVQTGLATYNSNGTLDYHPENTNTMVVLIGDNGTYAPGVKLPFNPARAKAFVYQTGVWVPLMIAGPMVSSPNRDVESMVNIADLFQLFGEVAGIDVRKAVPSSHILDSAPMLRYLTNPNQPSIRQTNFTQTGNNIQVTAPGPCVVTVTSPYTCAQLFTSKPLCVDEGGTWWGPDPQNPNAPTFTSCCAIQKAVQEKTFPSDDPAYMNMKFLPDIQNAIRNDNYKLVQIGEPDCTQQPKPNGRFPDTISTAFYPINEAAPVPMLDDANNALCGDGMPACPSHLTKAQLDNFNSLSNAMTDLLGSEPPCPGDGNEDKVVNLQDVKSWRFFSELTDGQSSWSDFNLDGLTDVNDLLIIAENFGRRCAPKK
jgi:Sulfatase